MKWSTSIRYYKKENNQVVLEYICPRWWRPCFWTVTLARRCSTRSSARAPASSTTSVWVAAGMRTPWVTAGAGRSSPATVAMATRQQCCARRQKVSVTSALSWQLETWETQIDFPLIKIHKCDFIWRIPTLAIEVIELKREWIRGRQRLSEAERMPLQGFRYDCTLLICRQWTSAAFGRRRGRLWRSSGGVSHRTVGLRLRWPMGRQRCRSGLQAARFWVCCFVFLHTSPGYHTVYVVTFLLCPGS